jgi:hypothetical protein
MWSKSAMRVDAGASIALWAQAREDFHEQTALEAVITFLQKSGRPRQMTFDRDPRYRWGCVRPGFSLAAASALVVPGDHAPCLPATSPRQKCLRGEIPQNLRARVLTHSSAKHAAGGA